MIFGGLEIVAGGYLIHRHYKKKNSLEKQKLEVEAQQRRNNTFPGANPQKPNGWNTQAHHRPSHHQHHGTIPAPQKYTYNAPVVPSTPLPQYQQQPAPQPQPFCQSPPTSPYDARPNRPLHTQSFSIPRRPVPTSDRKPEIIIPAGLQRSDSMATLSRMPIANGSRPSDIPEESSPVIQPPRRHVTGGLEVVPAQHAIYGNQAFSVSSPAFGATATSPPVVYEMATVDDNWETYGVANGVGGSRTTGYTPGYAPTVSTELGERDPPPPYVP